MQSSETLNPQVGMAKFLHIISKANNPTRKLLVNSVGISLDSVDRLATNILIYCDHLTSSPDFIKLVAIGWIGCFSTMVAGVEAAE